MLNQKLEQKQKLKKIDYSHQKQYRENKHRQNNNMRKKKMACKTTVRTFQPTNTRNCTRKKMDTAKKGKT